MASNSTAPALPMGLPPALQAEVNTNLGSVFIGLVISAAIFGVTNVQVFLYFSKYSKRDPIYLKTVVGTLYCLDWLHLILATHGVYFYTISNFANAAVLTTPVWSLVVQVIVSAISDMTVQLCYCWRIWIMSKRSWLLTGVGILLSALCLAFSLTFSGIILGFSSLLQYSSAAWALYIASATAVAGDAWISAVLCFYLFRSKTGWKATDTIATRLMIYIVNTGLLTTLVVTASLIAFATMPSSNIYIGIYLSYSKLYFNALLAMLNARDRLRGATTNVMGSSQLRDNTYASSQESNGFRMARMRKDQSSVGAMNSMPPPHVSLSRLESSVDMDEPVSVSELKRHPSGVMVTVQTDMMQHIDSDIDDGRSDQKYGSVLPL